MSDLHMAAFFVVFLSGYVLWNGTVAVRHHLDLGEVGKARYAAIVRGFSIACLAVSPLLMNLMEGPVLVGLAMLVFTGLHSVLDPQWRRDEADRQRALRQHPASTRPGRTSKPDRPHRSRPVHQES